MGSWNETCALSNLPICPGDAVYVFFCAVHSQQYLEDACYPNAYCDPLHAVPFLRLYDDYGRVRDLPCSTERKIVEEKEFHLLLSRLDGVADDVGDVSALQQHCLAYNCSGRDWHWEVERRVMPLLVRVDVWQQFVKLGDLDHLVPLKEMEEWLYERMHVNDNAPTNYTIEKSKVNVFAPSFSIGEYMHTNKIEILENFSHWKTNSALVDRRVCKLLAKTYYEFYAVGYTMLSLRRSWQMPSGRGSQQTSYAEHAKLFRQLAKLATKLGKEEFELL